MDAKLLNACGGKSNSAGGLNIPEFKLALIKAGIPEDIVNKAKTRANLHELCKTLNLKELIEPMVHELQIQQLQLEYGNKPLQITQREIYVKPSHASPLRASRASPLHASRASPLHASRASPLRASRASPLHASHAIRSCNENLVSKKFTKVKDGRLSARYYYDACGEQETIGDICNIRKDGELKCLDVDVNNNPRWFAINSGNSIIKHPRCSHKKEKCYMNDY